MHTNLYDKACKKRSINTTVNGDLLRQVKEAKINIAPVVEGALAASLKEHREKEWRKAASRAIEISNEDVEKNGLWADELRVF